MADSKRPVFILLNPPGTKPYQRDAFCSKTAKGGAVYPPVDLLLQSGWLAQDYQLSVIDAITDRLGPPAVLQRIAGVSQATGLLSVTGMVSWAEDRAMLTAISDRFPGLRLFGIGDNFLGDGAGQLETVPFLEGLLYDYSSDNLLRYLRGERDGLRNIIYRSDSGIIETPLFSYAAPVFTMPPPRYELFPYRKYFFPIAKKHPFAFVITNYGCPFNCSFCATGALGFKLRDLDDVFVNLDRISELGIPELFIGDSTFAAVREHAAAFCRHLINSDHAFSWSCFGRVDLMDEEILTLMRDAGCHTVIFGVESGADEILRRNNKHYCVAQVRKTFATTRKLGLRTVATYIFGLPGETVETAAATRSLALELDSDFASFNVIVKRGNTSLVKGKGTATMGDQSVCADPVKGSRLQSQEIGLIQQQAKRDYYLRTGYLWQRLTAVSSLSELRTLLRSGAATFRGFSP